MHSSEHRFWLNTDWLVDVVSLLRGFYGLEDDAEEECDQGTQIEKFDGEKPSPPEFELLCTRSAMPKELEVVVLRNFLSPAEVLAVHTVSHNAGVAEILDRDDDLDYVHRAFRVEKPLKKQSKELHARFMQTAWGLDGALWESISPGSTLEPEIEYIVYDVAELKGPGTIGPHTDNESMVTMIIMLSEPGDYEGGISCFQGASGYHRHDENRSVRLAPGDAIFFHGDQCFHWITPVTSGRRVILQMELSSGKRKGTFLGRWAEICAFLFLFSALNVFVLVFSLLYSVWLLIPVMPVMLLAECWMGLLVLQNTKWIQRKLPAARAGKVKSMHKV